MGVTCIRDELEGVVEEGIAAISVEVALGGDSSVDDAARQERVKLAEDVSGEIDVELADESRLVVVCVLGEAHSGASIIARSESWRLGDKGVTLNVSSVIGFLVVVFVDVVASDNEHSVVAVGSDAGPLDLGA